MSGRIPKGEELEALIFTIKDQVQFEAAAVAVFQFQYQNNDVYRNYCRHLGVNAHDVRNTTGIPFLPISFFKNNKIVSAAFEPEAVFESSGTTGSSPSRHYVKSLELYRKSFIGAFTDSYGPPKGYTILGLLPSYLERGQSSLVYMIKELMDLSHHPENGFFLHDYERLRETLRSLDQQGQKTLLIGVTYALLDFAAFYPNHLSNVVVMETGGMKGRRREATREEVHGALSAAFDLPDIHSEYGMTELLSQAYAKAGGNFSTPQWMKIKLRAEDDPLGTFPESGSITSGIINIIDLANIWSCSFLATDDVGRLHPDGTFEVLGRMDNSDVRGCSLMVV